MERHHECCCAILRAPGLGQLAGSVSERLCPSQRTRQIAPVLSDSSRGIDEFLRRVRLPGQDSHLAAFRQKIKSPLQQYEEAIGKPDEKVNMHDRPENPGWEAREFCKTQVGYSVCPAYDCEITLIPVPEWLRLPLTRYPYLQLTDMPGFDPKGPRSPETLGGTSVVLEMYVDDVDKRFALAVELGGTPLLPPTDMFFGDPDVRVLIFATAGKVTEHTKAQWAQGIADDFDLLLKVISREEFVVWLLDPANSEICRDQLGIAPSMEPDLAPAYVVTHFDSKPDQI